MFKLKTLGFVGGALLSGGIGDALDPPPSHTTRYAIVFVVLSASLLGWIFGAIGDEIKERI